MTTEEKVLYGVIGGSGVYKMNCLRNCVEVDIDTPFGKPSDKITIAEVDGVPGVKVAFIPRHNRNHIFTPSEVPYQANIYAMKKLGVRYLLAISAVGSLSANLRPGEIVIPHQLIDKTFLRKNTFFGGGCVGHVPFGLPFDPNFCQLVFDATHKAMPETPVHPRGTLVTMEGPAFSTKAESLANKAAGGDLIGMTTGTEAKLAREAEIAFCAVSMVTDMDAWSDEPHVSVDQVMKTLHDNATHAQIFTQAIIAALAAKGEFHCEAHDACQFAIMTKKEAIPKETAEKLSVLCGRWLK